MVVVPSPSPLTIPECGSMVATVTGSALDQVRYGRETNEPSWATLIGLALDARTVATGSPWAIRFTLDPILSTNEPVEDSMPTTF
jgi:hypothetical protein